jgi:hypothetical protein
MEVERIYTFDCQLRGLGSSRCLLNSEVLLPNRAMQAKEGEKDPEWD